MKEYNKYEFKKLMMKMIMDIEKDLDLQVYTEEYSSEVSISINNLGDEVAFIKIPYNDNSFNIYLIRQSENKIYIRDNKNYIIEYVLNFTKSISSDFGIPVLCTLCCDLEIEDYLNIPK